MKRKISIAFLIDKNNDWIQKYCKDYIKLKNNKNYKFIIINKLPAIKNKYDFIFVLGYTKIIPEKYFKYKNNYFVIHESNLPKNRGFSPIQWQILKNKNRLTVCLLKITKKADAGDIAFKEKLNLDGTELYDEIRSAQAKTTFNLINSFLKQKKIIYKKQRGNPSYLRRRTILDSKIDINKSIKSQFNLLRICNNINWPAFFLYKKKKYYIYISKKK